MTTFALDQNVQTFKKFLVLIELITSTNVYFSSMYENAHFITFPSRVVIIILKNIFKLKAEKNLSHHYFYAASTS